MQSKSIFDIVKNNPNYTPYRSSEWFQRNVRDMAKGMSVQGYLGDHLNIQASTFLPGQMIQFFYSAKGKDTLPYWDAFPCVLPFGMSSTHFTGLNLHYISPRYRLLLLSRLLEHVTDDKLSNRAKLKISWQLLRNASRFPEVAPCVKQYILGRVKSRFLIINPIDWPIAAVLPSERFRGAPVDTIFHDSTLTIKGMMKNG
jgi:hypothetical protein